jgi:hypothetical protein
MEYNRLMMSNSCNETPPPSNIAEFAETQNIATDTLLQWSNSQQ